MRSSVDLPTEQYEAFAGWIEAHKPKSDRNLHSDVVQYLTPELPPRVIEVGGRWVCGCSFRRLPGGVATLSGLRFDPGYEQDAASLLREVADRCFDAGIRQIQAISPAVEKLGTYEAIAAEALSAAGFTKLTQIQHRYLDRLPQSPQPQNLGRMQLSIRPMHQFTRKRAAKLVGATFTDTLDCPELDGIRTADEYLTGFLDGSRFREQKNWYALCRKEQQVGCLLLKSHGQAALEINYMGVVPNARGQRLGEFLIGSAMSLARHAGISIVVAAVDEKNRPAVKHYDRFGFEIHKCLDVWLYS